MLEKGEYFASLDKTIAEKDNAMLINKELTEVIAKYKANKKGRKA